MLRRHTDNGLLRYMLVGEGKVYLNNVDIQKYEALLDPKDYYESIERSEKAWKCFLSIFRWSRNKTYREVLDSYKRQDWWKTYDLV